MLRWDFDKHVSVNDSEPDEFLYLFNKHTEVLWAGVDEFELLRKINRFKSLNIHKLSDRELESEIDNIMLIDVGSCKISSTINVYDIYLKGGRFFRARKFESLEELQKNLVKRTDYWNPPEWCIKKYGRLNKPRESLLYTANNTKTALDETYVNEGEYFAIFVYGLTEDIQVAWIGAEANYSHHHMTNPRAIQVHEIYKMFLEELFSLEVPSGSENLYRTTEYIAKSYFCSPQNGGWRYRSMKDPNEYNVCFNPSVVKDKLELVCTIVGKRENSGMYIEYVATGYEDDNTKKVYDPDDKVVKLFLPELMTVEEAKIVETQGYKLSGDV